MQSQSSATERELLDSESIVSQQEQGKYSQRSFVLRVFGPIEAGAMRGSIFALLASAMGTGMFNLPYRINVTGVIPFIFFVIAGGLFSYLGMFLISRLIRKYKVESYSEMSEKAYGKNFRKVAEFCLIIYPWGITVCFQVIFAKFVMQLLDDNFDLGLYDDRQHEIYTQMGEWVRMAITVGAIVLNLFFILKKEIGILQKVAIIGVISVIINVAIIAITFFFTGFTTDEEIDGKTVKLQYEGIAGVDWANLQWAFLDGWSAYSQQVQGLASIIFCYVNHQLVFPLVFDLKNPSKRRLTKVFNRVHITEIIAYSMVGMCGYLLLEPFSEVRHINALVMASIPTSSMAIGKCLMVVSLFFAIPLNLFPARTVMYETFSLQKTNKNHVFLSLGLAFSGTIIAVSFQQVNSYFGLLGGTAGVMMAGAIPMICYWKLLGINSKGQMAMLIFMSVISLLGIVGAVLSVVDP